MLDLSSSRPLGRLCDGTSRREFLEIGSLSLGGLTLPQLLRGRAAVAAEGRPQKNTSVIFLVLHGGASQFETFDPKPEAVKEVRCMFGTTQTRLPGVSFCELLPGLAARADRLAIVKSFTHTDAVHPSGAHWVKTGSSRPPAAEGQLRP